MSETKRLYRSRSERMIAGICGGLGQYLGTDPTVIRLVFVLLAVLGPGVIVYLIAWLIVPEEPAAGEMVVTVEAQPAPAEEPEP